MTNIKCKWCGKSKGTIKAYIKGYYHEPCFDRKQLATRPKDDWSEKQPWLLEKEAVEKVRLTDDLLTSVNFNWEQAAKESRLRIIEKYNTKT